jgi:hypothetical protein
LDFTMCSSGLNIAPSNCEHKTSFFHYWVPCKVY